MFSTGETQAFDQLGDTRPRHAGRNPIEVGEIAQVIDAGEAPIQTALTAKYESDSTTYSTGLADNIQPEDVGFSRVGQKECCQDLDGGCLASAVGAKEPKQLTRLDSQIDPA